MGGRKTGFDVIAVGQAPAIITHYTGYISLLPNRDTFFVDPCSVAVWLHFMAYHKVLQPYANIQSHCCRVLWSVINVSTTNFQLCFSPSLLL